MIVASVGRPAPLAAQPWSGKGVAAGVVLGAEGQPLEGAVVEMRPSGAEAGPPATTTDAEGRWTLRGLAPGAWSIRVEAAGHRTGEGKVSVSAGLDPPIEMRLRSLEEVTPSATEGHAQTIRQWLEAGDSLLAQGEPGRARAEYEKALRAVPASERAAVLVLIGRTWYMEGDPQEAAQVLQIALRLDPGNDETRQIYRLVQEGRGAGKVADAFLSGLSDIPDPSAADDFLGASEAQEPPPEVAAQLGLPLSDPAPGRTGVYRVSFGSASPWSDVDTYLQRNGYPRSLVDETDPDRGRYDPAEESYLAYVPESYTPGAGWGLFVWVSPTRFGGTVWPEMHRLLAERKLIWIGANDAGNPRSTWDRYHLALDAAYHMARLYDLDPDRIYVGGYSGGGRVSGGLSILYPEIFRGGLWYMGCGWYDGLPIPDQPGRHWRPGFGRPSASQAATVRSRNRYVLVTGHRDFNRSECREVAETMREAGFAHVTFLDVPGVSHYDRAPIEWWAKALAGLDAE